MRKCFHPLIWMRIGLWFYLTMHRPENASDVYLMIRYDQTTNEDH